MLKRINKFKLDVTESSFMINSYPPYFEGTLFLSNAEGRVIQKGSNLKKISIKTILDIGDPDKFLDTLFNMIGFSDESIETDVDKKEEFVSKCEEKSKQESVSPPGGLSISLPPQYSNGVSSNRSSGSFSNASNVSKQAQENVTEPGSVAVPSPPPPPPFIREKGTGSIREVQMLAIQAMMQFKKVNYNDLVSAAFLANGINVEEIPSIEHLTEDQALEIIKYGNNKYKK